MINDDIRKVAKLGAWSALLLSIGCGNGPPIAPQPAGPLTIVLQTEAMVSRSVDETGATLSTTGADGTHIALTIPAAALPQGETTTISLTPLREFKGLPVSGQSLAAVQLEPHGLRFRQPVTLELTLPQGVDPTTLLAFTYDEQGDDGTVAFVPLSDYRAATSTAELALHHFSGAGIATGTTNDIRSNLAGIDDRFRQDIAVAQREADSTDALKGALSQIFIDWFEQVLSEAIRQLAGEELESTREVIAVYAGWLSELLGWQCKLDACGAPGNLTCFADSGFDPELDTLRGYAVEKFRAHLLASIADVNGRCTEASSPCERKALLEEALQWYELTQLGGVTHDPCGRTQSPDTAISDPPTMVIEDACANVQHEIFDALFFETYDAVQLSVGDKTFIELRAVSPLGRHIPADKDYGRRAWDQVNISWASSNPNVASTTEVTEQCKRPCGRGIVLTPKAPGKATITATATGEGVCDGPLQTVLEVVVEPDTRPPLIGGGGPHGTTLVLDSPKTVELRVSANDGVSLHYMFDPLPQGTGITQAVFYRDTGYYAPGAILGTGTCADGICRYSHTFPACFENPGHGGIYGAFAFGAVVYDGAGNASIYRLLGSIYFGTSNPPPC